MCQNNPNCNCPNCTQCQDCEQVVPNCTTTTTTTCTSEQFTEECPNGKQSTDCLVYTGPNLKNCNNQDTLFRGTEFNDFLSNLWETVKCAATPSTDTIDYTGANILDCNGNILVPTNTPVTEALNLIWEEVKCPVIPKATDLIIEDLALTDCDNNDVLVGDYTVFDTITSVWEYVKCLGNTSTSDNITFTEELKTCEDITLVSGTGNLTDAITTIWENIKCWFKDLTAEINKKQPIWQVSNIVTVGAGQPAPFNNIEAAVAELSKYHFDGKPIIIELLAGAYTVTSQYWYSSLLRNSSEVIFRNKLVGADITIQASLPTSFIGHEEGFATFKGIKFKQNGAGGVVYVSKGGVLNLIECLDIINSSNSNQPLLSAEDNGTLIVNKEGAGGVLQLQNLGSLSTMINCTGNSYMHLRLVTFNGGGVSPQAYPIGIMVTLNSKVEFIALPGTVATNIGLMYFVKYNSTLFINTGGATNYNNISDTFLSAIDNSNIFFDYSAGPITVNSAGDNYYLTQIENNSSIIGESLELISNNFWSPSYIENNSYLHLFRLTANNINTPLSVLDRSNIKLNHMTLTYRPAMQTRVGMLCSKNSFISFINSLSVVTSNPIKYQLQGFSQMNIPALTPTPSGLSLDATSILYNL